MKRYFVMILAASMVFFISSPGFAALYEGSWNSTSGALQTGEWSQVINGTSPTYVGSVLNMVSSGSQWKYLGAEVTGYSNGDYIPLKQGFYQDFSRTFDGGVFQFQFDGSMYSTVLDGTDTFRVFYNKNLHFERMSNAIFTGEGVIDQDPRFSISITMSPHKNWNTPPFSRGRIDYTQWDITSNTSNAVPIPGSLLLLGSGLLGLMGIRRRV